MGRCVLLSAALAVVSRWDLLMLLMEGGGEKITIFSLIMWFCISAGFPFWVLGGMDANRTQSVTVFGLDVAREGLMMVKERFSVN